MPTQLGRLAQEAALHPHALGHGALDVCAALRGAHARRAQVRCSSGLLRSPCAWSCPALGLAKRQWHCLQAPETSGMAARVPSCALAPIAQKGAIARSSGPPSPWPWLWSRTRSSHLPQVRQPDSGSGGSGSDAPSHTHPRGPRARPSGLASTARASQHLSDSSHCCSGWQWPQWLAEAHAARACCSS